MVLVLCAKLGMGRLGTITLDGTKVAANASKAANRMAGDAAEADRPGAGLPPR